MIRRKGIGKDCCGDPCGNKIRKINGISPDPNGEFSIEAGTGITVTGDENGVIIDASRAVGILTVNDEPPDADGNIKISGGSHVNVSESDSEIVIDTSGLVEGSGSIGSDVKPIKIVNGQAVAVTNDLVNVSSAQTITGLKTINVPNNSTGQFIKNTRIVFQNANIPDISTAPTTARTGQYIVFSTNETSVKNLGSITYAQNEDGSGYIDLLARRYTNTNSQHLILVSNATGGGYVTAPKRDYDPNNTSDVVTIGSLQQSSDVMHSAGNKNETVTASEVLLGS